MLRVGRRMALSLRLDVRASAVETLIGIARGVAMAIRVLTGVSLRLSFRLGGGLTVPRITRIRLSDVGRKLVFKTE